MTPRRRPRPRGFALVLVLIFVTLILGAWGVAARHTAAMIRIEQARAHRARRDAARLPALSALAAAAALLEVGYPPASPYAGAVPAADGTRYLARFAQDPASGTWTVSVAPGGEGEPLLDPAQFTAAPPDPGG